MPYKSVSDAVSKHPNLAKLNPTKQRQWVHIFNQQYEDGKSEATCFRSTNSIIKESAALPAAVLASLRSAASY